MEFLPEYKENLVAAKRALEEQFPIKYGTRELRLEKIDVGTLKDPEDTTAHKTAKINRTKWGVALRGTVSLWENGKLLDRQKVRLVNVPVPTNRWSYIANGSEYYPITQNRLKPGVYVHKRRTGEISAFFNLSKGRNMDITYDPEKQLFLLKYGTTTIPAYHVARALGLEDQDLLEAWGKDVFFKNAATKNELPKLLAAAGIESTPALAAKGVRELFDKTEMSCPEVNELTLGIPATKVNGEVFLAATRKLRNVVRGTEKPDRRDSLEFRWFLDMPAFIEERIKRSGMRQKFQHRMMRHDNVKAILGGSSPYDDAVWNIFGSSGLADRAPQTNPYAEYIAVKRVSIMGEGGVENLEAITENMRTVYPTFVGVIDPVVTPESEKTGIVYPLSVGATIKNNEPALKVKSVATGREEIKTVRELLKTPYTTLDEYAQAKKSGRKVRAVVGGRIEEINPASVKYTINPSLTFTASVLSTPFLGAISPNRLEMVSRHLTSAIALKDREKPLVMSVTDRGRIVEGLLGRMVTVQSPTDGTVTSVSNTKIIIRGKDGKLYKKHIPYMYPLNDGRSVEHHEPIVKKGDIVKKGQRLTEANTTKDGFLAMGVNARVAYLPDGYNFEDGITISESFARKLTSTALVQKVYDEDAVVDGELFSKTIRPLSSEERNALKNGVVKPGTIVRPGQILVAGVRRRPLSKEERILGKRFGIAALRDASISWDWQTPGVVKEVEKTPQGYYITVEVEEPAQPGDKLSGRHGNKGVIAKIKPDDEMPKTADGRPIEVLFNPVGVGGRMNLSAIYETLVGKVAEKEGHPILVNSFAGGPRIIEVPGHYQGYWVGKGEAKRLEKRWIENYSYERDYHTEVKELLKKHGLSDTEELFVNGKSIGKVLVGNQYIFKLSHQAEHKMAGRGAGYPYSYDADGTPAKGYEIGEGEEGKAQSADRAMILALLAHGATENVREMLTYRGDKDNDAVWTAVQLGQNLPPPRVPRVYRKFEAYLNAAGLKLERDGDDLWLLPMTDKEILAMSNGEITEPTLFSGKTGKAKHGELFDEEITGGLEGKGWGHITLPYEIPNPVFIKPIAALLGLTNNDVIAVAAGKKGLTRDEKGRFKTVDGPGTLSLKQALSGIDIDKELQSEEDPLRKRYLMALKETGHTPEIYLLKHIPVLPPIFRPITTVKGRMIIADLNLLYSDLITTSKTLKGLKKETPELLADEEGKNLRTKLYEDVAALYGLGTAKHYRDAQGIFEQLHGPGTIKYGMIHNNIMRRRQDLSARAVIVPGPGLHIDEVGVPRELLREMMGPFLVRELTTLGLTPLAAKRLIKERPDDPLVNTALDRVCKNRPVWMKRDPVLHKFGVMAFYPVPTNDNVIEFHPLVTGVYNADFDGDQVGLFVPVSDEAVEEAKRSMPSRLLRSPATGEYLYTPTQEALYGLYCLTEPVSGTPKKTFKDAKDVITAVKSGAINVTTPIKLDKTVTTPGKVMVAALLPKDLRSQILSISAPAINKKTMSTLAKSLGEKYPDRYGEIMDALRDLGTEYSYRSGVTLTLDDIKPMKKEQKVLVKMLEKSKQREVDAPKVLAAAGKLNYPESSTLIKMNRAGIKPTTSNLQQMLVSPVVGDWGDGNIVPVRKSFAEGLNSIDYWSISPTARKALASKVRQVRLPGDLTKQMLATTMSTVISEKDCGSAGAVRPLSDAMDRILGEDVGGFKAGTVVTGEVMASLKRQGINRVKVRTPLTCQSGEGICAKCFGMSVSGLPQVGDNVGINAAMSLGERGTQLSMRAFHTGGFGELPPLDQVSNLLRLPENMPGKASLAQIDGRVRKIEKTSDGTWIHISDGKKTVKVFASPNSQTLVKTGQRVHKGEAITSGTVDPREVFELTGSLSAAQRSLTDSLNRLYERFGIDPRNIEILVRGMTNLAIVNDPGTSGRLKGEYVPYYWAQRWNAEHDNSLKVTPVIKGVTSLPIYRDPWTESIGYRGIKPTLLRAAATAEKGPAHSLSPVPAWIMGAEFGKPRKKGKPEY